MAWFKLDTWLACVMCGVSRGTQHRVCNDCWQSLVWDYRPNTRQEVQFIASCQYQYPMDRLIHGFKDQAQMQYLALFAACLLRVPKPAVQALVPMPISTEKLIQRGFSQTHLLAKILARHWQLPIWQPIIRQHGESQRNLDRHQRLQNLAHKFHPDPENTKFYAKVLMIDDVITTGASLFALQEQLKLLGCRQIQALCICNATSD